ncbi:MAG: aminotransferase class I/II-fold pyridoxal phosphate-dependent enzyme [Beijerinckiaceae bacterium]|nr:aminotransferase class I/II-fold pyridoxal phosphate-dependent enzyme [Beijerinckiaceae bacterium]
MNHETPLSALSGAARRLTPSRRSRVAPFIAMDVMSAAARREREGASVIHMEVGEPGAPTPAAARDAAMAALAAGRIGYTEALGRLSLRARIARHYGETYGVDVDPARIVVTTGSSAGFLLSFLALFDAGARVAIAAPGYPAYRNILDALGIETVSIETRAETRHVVTAEMIEAAHADSPLDGVLLMSPANPSGTMMSPQALAAICETCDRLGIAFISDEIYHGLTYVEPAETALKFSRSAVVVNSFSKYFCMTGWRIGWLVLPDEMVRPVERLQQSLAISVPMLSQVAAEAVFESRPELEAIKASYARNRDVLLQSLPGLGLGSFHPVDGAFYVYLDIGHLTNDSSDFCQRMLVEAGVAATPGLDFDRERGSRTMRLSFAGSESDVVEAVARLRGWLK